MLLSNDVASLTTAPNGMLWLGTNAGIQVLDPAFPDMLWTTYRKADTPGMGGNWGVAAAAAPDGTVWIAMTNGDASRFRDGVWQSFAELRSYDSVAVDADGRAWFGDEDKGIVVLNDDGSTAMTLTMAEGLPSNRVTALLADGETMWIAQDVGLTKYADGQVTLVLDKNRLPHPYLQALALDAAGKLLVGANLSIVRYDGDQTETLINFQQEKQMAWLTTLAVERDGRIWAGTANGLYYSDNGSDWNRMTTADGLLANYISALLVDQYGTLWIGGGGLLHIVP
jgi:ligand-binding sensor domain-containing protein